MDSVDAIVKRREPPETIAKLVRLQWREVAMNIAKIVREAREQSRLTALDFANGIFDEFIELHGDRSFRDDGAVIGGIGWLGDQAVTVAGIQKGKSLHDNLKRELWATPSRRLSQGSSFDETGRKFGRPVVTFINTAGAYPGVGAEERGQGSNRSKPDGNERSHGSNHRDYYR